MARDYVKAVLCRVLKISKGEINNRASFEKYGVDSLVVMEINRELEKDFGKLPATLLFEHMSVEALANYFITHQRSTLESMLEKAKPGSRYQSRQSQPVVADLDTLFKSAQGMNQNTAQGTFQAMNTAQSMPKV